jgi:uncharacterized protein YjiS (DUF1127 family)
LRAAGLKEATMTAYSTPYFHARRAVPAIPQRRGVPPPADLATILRRAWRAWRQRAQQRATLAKMSERELRDIGIGDAERIAELDPYDRHAVLDWLGRYGGPGGSLR